ncbi:MAG: methionine--tRNA ligase [Candidatus Neomarinimicrobiota bacterium]
MKNFYITTPIYYVNDKPHIGHAYTTILADVLSRFHRAQGDRVFFLTGLDEHGQKVQQAAEKRGVDPQTHCDEMAPRFLELWEKLHIKYDDFIRTTEPRHVEVVKAILKKVHDRGDIYEAEYTGLYSVAEERFITEKEAESGEFRDIKKLHEKNYFFRMSNYQKKLIKHINENPGFIQPKHRKNEILGFLKNPLNDLCISRPKSRLSWGIELPFDEDYVTYVWFDALINYITAAGFGNDMEKFNQFWPADYHLIGKDILTTHCVYWPTMLMSADIPLPRSIFAHGWWLSDESKISKSLGNAVNPLELIEQFGVDPVRYYLMREMVLGKDANFTSESFIKRYNSDLANDFGNLLSRVTRLMEKFFAGRIPHGEDSSEQGQKIKAGAVKTIKTVQKMIIDMKLNDALEQALQYIRSVNKYMEIKAPWKLAKENHEEAGFVLHTAAEALRIGTLLLKSVMPNRSEIVLETLGAVGSKLEWGGLKGGILLKKHEVLFPRIKIEKPGQSSGQGAKHKEISSENSISKREFDNVELLTGVIIKAEKIPGTDRLLKLQVKIGTEIRQIVSGIAEYYDAENLTGKMIIVAANLEPATIKGVKSHGMLLAASKGKELTLVTLDSQDIDTDSKVF